MDDPFYHSRPATQDEPTRIIFDSDNTMGIPGCDIDDGLALLFALAHAHDTESPATIEGICTSYGNSTLDAVDENTRAVCRELNLAAPVFRGARDADHPDSEAAHFLVAAAQKNPGKLSLAVTGSTTNLKGAIALDKDILSRYKEVVLMGGITQTLAFNGVIMNELNFSCDAQATYEVLDSANRGANIVVATSNQCLPCHFFPEDFKRELVVQGSRDGGYLYRTCAYWFDDMKTRYKLEGFCCWDVLVSAYILCKDLFYADTFDVALDPRLLQAGFLAQASSGTPHARIVTPRIKNPPEFNTFIYRSWRRALDECKR
ncbi:MAG: nucleoside hydrolase [Raoultibacter sp.]